MLMKNLTVVHLTIPRDNPLPVNTGILLIVLRVLESSVRLNVYLSVVSEEIAYL